MNVWNSAFPAWWKGQPVGGSVSPVGELATDGSHAQQVAAVWFYVRFCTLTTNMLEA